MAWEIYFNIEFDIHMIVWIIIDYQPDNLWSLTLSFVCILYEIQIFPIEEESPSLPLFSKIYAS